MIYDTQHAPEIEEVVKAWQSYIATMGKWQEVVDGIVPKETDCGPIYELDDSQARPHESFAISDMRDVRVAKPHYHTGETEIYIVLSGSGLTVVGGEELRIHTGDVVITPPQTAHFTIPDHNLVMAVINTPPFNPANVMPLDTTHTEVKYDHDQYTKLTA